MEQQPATARAGEHTNTRTSATLHERLAALEAARQETARERALLREERTARHAEEQLRALVQQHAPALWRDAPTGVRPHPGPRRGLFRRKR